MYTNTLVHDSIKSIIMSYKGARILDHYYNCTKLTFNAFKIYRCCSGESHKTYHERQNLFFAFNLLFALTYFSQISYAIGQCLLVNVYHYVYRCDRLTSDGRISLIHEVIAGGCAGASQGTDLNPLGLAKASKNFKNNLVVFTNPLEMYKLINFKTQNFQNIFI